MRYAVRIDWDARDPCPKCGKEYACTHTGRWRVCGRYRAYLHSRWQWPTRGRLDLVQLARRMGWK